jgi:hypothetical protein
LTDCCGRFTFHGLAIVLDLGWCGELSSVWTSYFSPDTLLVTDALI